MAKRRDRTFQVRVDDETLEGAQDYAESKGIGLGTIIRAFLKLLAQDPPADLDFLPIDEEQEKAPYKPRKGKRRPKTSDSDE